MPISRIKTDGIQDDAITSAKIGDTNVATADIANNSVTSAKLDTNIAVSGTFGVTGDLTVDTDTLFADASADKVGINTTAMDASLEVNSASSKINTLTVKTGAGSGGVAGIGFMAGQTAAGREKAAIFFKETNGGAHYTGDIVFAVANSSGNANQVAASDEVCRITPNGIAIGGTGAANTLDDYEEGTWTATLGGTSSNPTVSSYSYNSGHYTKIGRQVFAHIYMRIESGNISGGSGDATILGLPFQSKSGGSISNGAGAWIENYTYTANSFSSGRSYARPVMVAGENRMRIYQLSYSNPQQATGWALTQADDAALMFGGVMVYMTD